MNLDEFKSICVHLLSTCVANDYLYEIGVGTDNEPFLKIFGHSDRMFIGPVIFRAVPSCLKYFVSVDSDTRVPYVFIYRD